MRELSSHYFRTPTRLHIIQVMSNAHVSIKDIVGLMKDVRSQDSVREDWRKVPASGLKMANQIEKTGLSQ